MTLSINPNSNWDFISLKLNKEIYGTSIIEAIHHKVYEKQVYGENPKAAIISLEAYSAIQKLYDTKSISIRGCELKLYTSPMLSAEQIEIY